MKTQLPITKFKKSSSFSFRSKSIITNLSSTSLENSPSPNLYSPEKLANSGVKIGFVKALRKTFFDRKVEKLPGPGQYQPSVLTSRCLISKKSDSKFQTCSSRFYNNVQEMPGPGAYQIKNDFKKTLPSFSIRKKTKSFHDIEIQQNSFRQDPGAYNISATLFRDSSVISIPKQSRIKQKKSNSPGPGRYETNQALFSSQISFGKRSFSSSIRKINFEIKNYSPGPAGYAPQSSFQLNRQKQKGFSCRKKLNETINKESAPGPGQYQLQSNPKFRSAQSCKIPQAERKTQSHIHYFLKTMKSPGPGKYQNLNQTYSKLNFNQRSAPRFSKAKLQHISSVIKLGATDKIYDPKINLIKRSSSSFSIGSQRRKSIFQKKLQKIPGPGNYNPQDKILRQGYSSSAFPRSVRHNPILNKLKIGPGQYYNDQVSSSIGKVGVKFSKQQRKTDFSHLQNQEKQALRSLNTISSQSPQLKLVRK